MSQRSTPSPKASANSWCEQLSPLDAWFLYLERPNAPLHLGGVYIFEGRSSVKGGRGALGIAQTLASRLHLVPRYRQKLLVPPLNLGRPAWVDDADFDLSYHVRRAALPAPGGDAELRDYVARVFSRPLDLRRPLWEVYIVEGLEDGRVAVVNKVHHSMVDGVAAVDMGSLLLDLEADGGSVRPSRAPRWEPRPAPAWRDLVAGAALSALDPLQPVRALARGGLQGAVTSALDAVLRSPWAGAAQLAMSSLAPGPRLHFNAHVGQARRVQHVRVELEQLKRVKNVFGGTVNDVVLAIVASAMRSYLEHRGDEVPSHVRAYCPVSVREGGGPATGNALSGMLVDLPTEDMPPLNRLSRITHTTGDLKRSRQAVAAEGLIALAGWGPAGLQAGAARLVAGRMSALPQPWFNFIVTNVPGPQLPFFTGGARLIDIWPFVPIYEQLGLGVAVVSYNGGVHFGLLADRDLVPDLDVLAAAVAESAAEYADLAGRFVGPEEAGESRRHRRPRQAKAGASGGSSKPGSARARARATGG